MATGQNWPLTNPKPLDRSEPNSIQFFKFGRTPHRPNIIISRKTGPAHKGSAYKLCVSFFCSFLVIAPSKIGSAEFDNLYAWRRGLVQRSAFGVPNVSKNFQGVHFHQTSKIGPGLGISSLNYIMNNLSTVYAIFAQISSIGAAWRMKLKNSNEITKISF
jgi:hypothetical protein